MRVWHESVAPDSDAVLEFDAADVGEPNLGYIAENQLLQWALLGAFAEAGGHLEPASLESLEITDAGVGILTGRGRLAARLVVGADGAESRVREAAGIAADSVTFVNVGPTAKIAALKSHTVDIISDFYNEHDLKVIEFGSDLGYINWKDIGLNPYGNSLIVNGAFLEKNPKLVEDFVKVTQRAYAACVADVAPCLKALLDQVSGLDKENQERQWERIKFLMTDDFTTTKALGWIDGERMKKDYELVQTYLGMEKPFDVQTAYTTKMLDPAIKMDASKVKK